MSLGDRIAAGALVTALAAIGLGAWLAVSPGLAPSPPEATLDPFGASSSSPGAGGTDPLVVDIEGAVARPGIIELPAGSRVADAVAAAGGYSAQADLVAAAAQVNLAAELRDGQQIVVPAIGATAGGGSGSGGGGLVNLNTASPEELDALPGIGPVTVQKVVAARTEQPFASLDELVTRKVMTGSQVDKIRDLVTVG